MNTHQSHQRETRKEISPYAIVGRQSDQRLPAHNFVVVGGIVGVVDDCDGVNVFLQGRRSEVLFGIQLHCNCNGSKKRKHNQNQIITSLSEKHQNSVFALGG